MRRLAIAALLLGGCWVPVERGKQMEARIQRLEEENDRLGKQLDEERKVIREAVDKVDQKIVEVQKKLDELNAAAHRTGADLAVNQDRIQEDLVKTKGSLEEELHRLQLLEQALATLKDDVDHRFAALKGAGALDEFEARKKVDALKRPADKAAFLALAQKQDQAGEAAVARELYEEYAKKWPTDPHCADVHFRLGEMLFAEKKYREAILQFGKVAQDFPRSDKVPDALYRTAESMAVLDLKDDAKAIFEDLMKRFPKTTAAQKAKARVAELTPAAAPKDAKDPKKKGGKK